MDNLELERFSPYVEALSIRCEEPLVDDVDVKSAKACLMAAWEYVVYYGLSTWTLEACPRMAVITMIEAGARGWQNIGGYTDERADTVTLRRADEYARATELTPIEIERLETIAGKRARKGVITNIALSSNTPVSRSSYESYSANKFFDFQVYGPTISPQQALPIPGLPSDLEKPNANIRPYEWGFKEPRRWGM